MSIGAAATNAVGLPGPADRQKPNILLTGTPGTGKSCTADLLAEILPFKFINVGKEVREKGFHSGHDTTFDTFVLDEDSEDKLLDYLEPIMAKGGNIVEFHSPELFPERWFDLVVVLTSDNTVLYDRLIKRGYNNAKVQENIQCEIMRVVATEAAQSYKAEIVKILKSNTIDELEDNVNRIVLWSKAYIDAKSTCS